MAVRGAKPSASNFYFHCDSLWLPTYQTTPQYETMTCTVYLADRYGNRVGIPTPVLFATESGAITASAITGAYIALSAALVSVATPLRADEVPQGGLSAARE